ncbi:MAG: diguanylate cyclase [Burkholderiales bacterium]|nr:diguanylate cyclase [Burkholderiales bacterium]
MPGNYDFQLVLLSLAVAIMTSYAALDLASRVSGSGWRPWLWLAGGAAVMGAGIWSMHFIGMLAFSLPIPLGYDLGLTLLSLLIAIVVSGFALAVVRSQVLTAGLLSTGAALLGIGISAMHYTGMAALQMSPPIRYDPVLFVVSVLIAIAASFAALWLAFELRRRDSMLAVLARLGSAGVMGLAITGMHYTGMAAAEFIPGSICLAADAGGVNSDLLAAQIGVAIFGMLSVTVVLSALDGHRAARVEKMAATLLSANEQLQLTALHDPLTGLPNRVLLSDRLMQAQFQADRSGQGFAVMFIDLDHFKAVNDSYGHRVGDDLLRGIAQALGSCIRREDTVSRTGGDEFVAVLNGIKSRADAEAAAGKILAALAQPFQVGPHALKASCSIGISLYPADGVDAPTLMANADAAMYRAKKAGRSGYRLAADTGPVGL